MYIARTISLRDFYLFYNWWLGRQSKLTEKQLETEKTETNIEQRFILQLLKEKRQKRKNVNDMDKNKNK